MTRGPLSLSILPQVYFSIACFINLFDLGELKMNSLFSRAVKSCFRWGFKVRSIISGIGVECRYVVISYFLLGSSRLAIASSIDLFVWMSSSSGKSSFLKVFLPIHFSDSLTVKVFRSFIKFWRATSTDVSMMLTSYGSLATKGLTARNALKIAS